MSDNPLDQVLARLAAIEAGQARLMEQVDDQIERVMNCQGNLEHEFQHAKDFLAGDALIAGRRWLDMDARLTRLEDEWRRFRRGDTD
jgi:hypothetical protein